MDPLSYGDPYIAWSEENAAQESSTEEDEVMFNLDELKADVVKYLVISYDYTMEDAYEAVTDSVSVNADMWSENASAADLANYLATDDEEE